MKRVVGLSSALLIAGSLMAGSAMAIDTSAADNPQGSMWQKDWTQELSLSPEQKRQFDDVAKNFSSAEAPLHQKEKQLVKSLQTEVASNAASSQIEGTLNDLQSNQKAMEDERYNAWKQTSGFLNPAQRAKLALAFMSRHGAHKNQAAG